MEERNRCARKNGWGLKLGSGFYQVIVEGVRNNVAFQDQKTRSKNMGCSGRTISDFKVFALI